MRTLIRTGRSSIVCVLSDIVKRGSYRAYEHEESCAYVHVLPQQLVAADILARRRSLFPRKREGGRRRDIRQRVVTSDLVPSGAGSAVTDLLSVRS
jgi:hypothetical protein